MENALKDTSSFTRPDNCEACGRTCVPHAHHYKGYEPEHWLDVQWLCVPCHDRAHREEKPE